MSTNQFNAVIILDAIPMGESNTARRLKEELEDIASYVAPGLQILYARVETMSDLERTISDLLYKNRVAGLYPMLHLEGHGMVDESGFVLADLTPCSWKNLKKIITPLNIAMGLNLLLVMATCYGGSFAKAIDATDRAPVWCLIGPTQEVTAGDVEKSFLTFYKTFFNSLSSSESLKALNDSAPHVTYFITIAEHYFYAIWKGYKLNWCSEEIIEERAAAMYHKALSMSLPNAQTVEEYKQLLMSKQEEKNYFDICRDKFFMYDLYPSNRSRFPVTYEEAEKNIVD